MDTIYQSDILGKRVLNETKIAAYSQYLIEAIHYLRIRCSYQLEQLEEQTAELLPAAPIPQTDDQTPFATFIREHQLSGDELALLLVALVPYVLPGFFDSTVISIFPQGSELPQLGGVKGGNHRGTLPTGETALFVLAGNDLADRLDYLPLLDGDSFLMKSGVLSLQVARNSEPILSGRLISY